MLQITFSSCLIAHGSPLIISGVKVQLQLLSATVKTFLRRPDEAKDMVSKILPLAAENADNPDLRDRAYIYWRLLSISPEATQAVVSSI
jgi:AP-1 complex subunit beta-1